jgi:TetR/AcrR family transcriptional regulator
VTEERESYSPNGVTLEVGLSAWADSIPGEFRPPVEGTPRARILDAAARLFSNDGFSQSTTRAIAEAAGVNQAMIHYYFQSKTRLYERVLAGMVVDLLTSLAGSLGTSVSSPLDALVGFPERIVKVFVSDPIRVSIFRREIGDGAPHLHAVIDQLDAAGPRGFRAIMQRYIDAARKSGEIAGASAETLLEFLLVNAYGAVLVEPMLQHIFASADKSGHLVQMVKSHREFIRRALTQPTKEDETK